MCIIIGTQTYTYAQQSDKEQSKTQSALCTAQSQTFKTVFNKVYSSQEKVDIHQIYKDSIQKKIAGCLTADLILWGKWVQTNIESGKFKKYRLSFEKPSDNNFKVPGKAKRAYKKAFKKVKRDFISSRKNKTLDEVLNDKNLQKYIIKTTKAFVKQKNKYLKKIVK